MSETTPFPQTALALSDQPDDQINQDNDDNPQTALELIRDAIRLHNNPARTTTLQRGSYEVLISRMPDHETDPVRYVLHLNCLTNTVIPDYREPGTAVQTSANLWVEPLDIAQEMVAEYLRPGALDEYTPPKQHGQTTTDQEGH